jgi:hypothetical protein
MRFCRGFKSNTFKPNINYGYIFPLSRILQVFPVFASKRQIVQTTLHVLKRNGFSGFSGLCLFLRVPGPLNLH